MVESSILDEILKELKRDKKRYPNFPVHIVAQASLISSASGLVLRKAIKEKYHSGKADIVNNNLKELEHDVFATAALCIRFIEALRKDK